MSHRVPYHMHVMQVGKDKVRPALSLVDYEDELQPAMAFVFGSTLVCDTLETAMKVYIDLYSIHTCTCWCTGCTSIGEILGMAL